MTQFMVLLQHLHLSKALTSTYVSAQTGMWKNKYVSVWGEWVSKQASKKQTYKQKPDWLTDW